MRSPRTTRYKNITRVDHPAKRTFGYMVRVQWKGERRYKFFSDKAHGDRLGALSAAIEWRNGVERDLGKPRTERLVIGKVRQSNSGITGVRKRREGNTDYYEATWMISPGKYGRTRYSVSKYGEAKARRLAKRAREVHEKLRWKMPARRNEQGAPDQPANAVAAPLAPTMPQEVPGEDLRWNELVAAATREA